MDALAAAETAPRSSRGAAAQAVRTALRVRPLLPREAGQREGVRVSEEDRRLILVDEERCQERCFTADAVLDSRRGGMNGCQQAVFEALGDELAQRALEGYNACLLAYGHTGSGKTHTILGEDWVCTRPERGGGGVDSSPASGRSGWLGQSTPLHSERGRELSDDLDGSGAGLLPRVLEYIFNSANRSEGAGEKGAVYIASFYEIHNERVRDLVGNVPGNPFGCEADSPAGYGKDGAYERSVSGGMSPGGPLCHGHLRERPRPKVHFHPKFGAFVSDVAEVPCSTYEEALRLVTVGARSRTTAATALNDRSSRSHAVFTLRIERPTSSNSLTLVDLAGREQERLTQCRTERFKELTLINRSLFHLARCVRALADRGRNDANGVAVPGRDGGQWHHFRNSKLTMVLGHALAGNSHTAVIGTISPARGAYEDSLATLRFVESVKQVRTRPALPINRREDVVNELQEEVRRLSARLRLQDEANALQAAERSLVERKLGETQDMMEQYRQMALEMSRHELAHRMTKEVEPVKQQAILVPYAALTPGCRLPPAIPAHAGSMVVAKAGVTPGSPRSHAGISPVTISPRRLLHDQDPSTPTPTYRRVVEAGTGGPPVVVMDSGVVEVQSMAGGSLSSPSRRPAEAAWTTSRTASRGGSPAPLRGLSTASVAGGTCTSVTSSAGSEVSTPRFKAPQPPPGAVMIPDLLLPSRSPSTASCVTSVGHSQPAPVAVLQDDEMMRIVEHWLAAHHSAQDDQAGTARRTDVASTLQLLRAQLRELRGAQGGHLGRLPPGSPRGSFGQGGIHRLVTPHTPGGSSAVCDSDASGDLRLASNIVSILRQAASQGGGSQATNGLTSVLAPGGGHHEALNSLLREALGDPPSDDGRCGPPRATAVPRGSRSQGVPVRAFAVPAPLITARSHSPGRPVPTGAAAACATAATPCPAYPATHSSGASMWATVGGVPAAARAASGHSPEPVNRAVSYSAASVAATSAAGTPTPQTPRRLRSTIGSFESLGPSCEIRRLPSAPALVHTRAEASMTPSGAMSPRLRFARRVPSENSGWASPRLQSPGGSPPVPPPGAAEVAVMAHPQGQERLLTQGIHSSSSFVVPVAVAAPSSAASGHSATTVQAPMTTVQVPVATVCAPGYYTPVHTVTTVAAPMLFSPRRSLSMAPVPVTAVPMGSAVSRSSSGVALTRINTQGCESFPVLIGAPLTARAAAPQALRSVPVMPMTSRRAEFEEGSTVVPL